MYEQVSAAPGRWGPRASALVEEARRLDDAEALVVALRAAAWFERSRLANDKALALLDDALAVARRTGLPARAAEVLVTRAAVNQELGRIVSAGRDLDRAEKLAGAASAEPAFMRAVLLHNVGRLGAAANAYRQILDHPAASLDNRGSAASNLAVIEAAFGRFDRGLKLLDRAATLAEGVGGVLAAFVAHNRGLLLAQSGRLAESFRQFDTATALCVEVGFPLGEFQAEHAETLAELRLLPEALELAGRAAVELEVSGVPLMAAEARLTAARAALRAGDPAAASGSARRARELFRRQRRPVWAARAVVVEAEAGVAAGLVSAELSDAARRAAGVLDRAGLASAAVGAHLAAGSVAEALGRTDLARRSFRAAAALPRRGSIVARLAASIAAAHTARLDGDDGAVLARCRGGLADLARHRAALGSAELRALASGHGVELGLLGLGCLLRTGSPSRVLDWVERIRAAALLTVEPPAPDIVREERAELAAVQAELITARRETGTEPAELIARQAALEHRIRRATWNRAGTGVVSGAAIRTGQLVGLLDGRALVSYGRFDDEMFAVVLHAGRRLVRLGAWDAVRFEGDAVQFALRRLTRSGPPAALDGARASAAHSLARLREVLVEPLGIPADVPLVVVPARDTHRLPWSALHTGPVEVAPSATLWAATRTRTATADGRVLVVAGPDLPGAEGEAAAVAGCHPAATVLVPPKSTTETVLAAMQEADLVHLACHGFLRGDNPTFSALDVCDGRVTVQELDLRGIAPHRVVLAACDSAADVAYAGDELLGFVSALLARGTAGLVASTVAVGDTEAVPLMRALHERIAAGAGMAEALHAARAGVDRDDPRGFVNWCAFTAYGAG